MGKITFKNKQVPYNKRGDRILVKLMQSGWAKENTYYEKEVSLNDKKGMNMLATDLKSYGIILVGGDATDWFD